MEEQYATQLAILSDIWNNLKRLPYIRHYERAIANLYDYVSSRAHLSSHSCYNIARFLAVLLNNGIVQLRRTSGNDCRAPLQDHVASG